MHPVRDRGQDTLEDFECYMQRLQKGFLGKDENRAVNSLLSFAYAMVQEDRL